MNSSVTTTGIWRQRLGYGVADLGCNLVWQMLTLYLMFFYTDVAGLSAVQVGLLLLITRIIDGAADLLMGLIIDKTRSRWGKSRPYFLWGAAPFTFFALLAFYVPSVGPGWKLAYAYVTYTCLSLAYTMVNMPLTSILPSLSADPHERTMLATSRNLFAFLGSTIVAGCTLTLVKRLGAGTAATGFFRTMCIYAVSGGLMLYITFRNVEEKVKIRPHSLNFAQSLIALKNNTPWLLFAINIIFMWGAYFLQQGALLYFYRYQVCRPDMISVMAALSTLVPLFGTLCTPFLSKRLLKRNIFLAASGIHLAGIVVMILAGTAVSVLIVGTIISALGFGLRHTIYFSMQADPVDYGEWRTGVNAGGLIAAINQFIGKMAMALAGILAGIVLTWGRYIPNQQQSASGLLAIKLNFLYLPAGLIVISMGIMRYYHLDKILQQIRATTDPMPADHTAQPASPNNQQVK